MHASLPDVVICEPRRTPVGGGQRLAAVFERLA